MIGEFSRPEWPLLGLFGTTLYLLTGMLKGANLESSLNFRFRGDELLESVEFHLANTGSVSDSGLRFSKEVQSSCTAERSDGSVSSSALDLLSPDRLVTAHRKGSPLSASNQEVEGFLWSEGSEFAVAPTHWSLACELRAALNFFDSWECDCCR